jgi:hypothetical protein
MSASLTRMRIGLGLLSTPMLQRRDDTLVSVNIREHSTGSGLGTVAHFGMAR